MFVRLHRQKQRGKVYTSVQLCESYRDPAKGNAPRNRVLLNLGPLDKLGSDTLQKLGEGFLRAAQESRGSGGASGRGRGGKGATEEALALNAWDFGHVYAVSGVWDRLGLSEALQEAGLEGRSSFGASEMIRLLVVNRLCEPTSKWALLDWMEGVFGLGEAPPYHHLLRAMDRLLEGKEEVEQAVARRVVGEGKGTDLVFYDITSTYFEGDRSLNEEDDLRRYGYSRDGRRDRRQVVIGVVMTREGIPLCHHVFPGNTADKTTVAEVVRDLKRRFRPERVIFVGDRGMLTDANLECLLTEEVGFIVAHPLRRNAVAREVIAKVWRRFDRKGDAEQFFEDVRQGVRFVVAYSPQIARETKEGRKERLAQADAWIRARLEALARPAGRGRRPTPQSTYDRIRDYLRDKGLLRFYNLALSEAEGLQVSKDRKALLWEAKIDGVLLVETTDLERTPEEIIGRYKELAEIERGWRCLKSTVKVRPVYHWTERRIRAHIFVCVLALQVERWMRNRLRPLGLSVPRAVSLLQRNKVVELVVSATPTRVTTRPTREQARILRALGLPPIPKTL
ncbi:IS1634 family transposase [Deferrisoma sp.]